MGKTRAILNLTNFDSELRTGLWTECANCVSQLHKITIKIGKEQTAYEEFYNRLPNYSNHLRTFGKMCIRTVRKGLQEKLDNRRKYASLLGIPKIIIMIPSGFSMSIQGKLWSQETSDA